jgi:sarcosine oxidase subunit beta
MNADVLIVGGGLMGCSIAIDLVRHGKTTIVFDKDVPGRHASGHNSGLRLAENAKEMAMLERRHAQLVALGFEHEVLADREEVRRLSPNVAERVVGGLVCHSDGLANPMVTSKAYAKAAGALGARILPHTQIVSASQTTSGFAVQTSDGKLHEGGVLINAAGAWAGELSAMLDDPLPIIAAAPTMMVTARVPGLMNGTSLGLTGRPLGLMAASNGTIIVGGGFRSPLDLANGKIRIDSMQMAKAAKTMIEILPALRGVSVVRFWSAFEGCLADKAPVIGESARISGLFHACGFSAHGFQLGPAVGRVVSQLVRGLSPELSLSDFRPDRFAC